jgi:hypothetical protein
MCEWVAGCVGLLEAVQQHCSSAAVDEWSSESLLFVVAAFSPPTLLQSLLPCLTYAAAAAAAGKRGCTCMLYWMPCELAFAPSTTSWA